MDYGPRIRPHPVLHALSSLTRITSRGQKRGLGRHINSALSQPKSAGAKTAALLHNLSITSARTAVLHWHIVHTTPDQNEDAEADHGPFSTTDPSQNLGSMLGTDRLERLPSTRICSALAIPYPGQSLSMDMRTNFAAQKLGGDRTAFASHSRGTCPREPRAVKWWGCSLAEASGGRLGRSGPASPSEPFVHIVLARPAANPTRKRTPVNTSCTARNMAGSSDRRAPLPLREGITQSRY